MLLSTSSLSYPRNTCVNSVSSTAILPPGSVPRSWGLVRDVSIVRARDIRRARLPTGCGPATTRGRMAGALQPVVRTLPDSAGSVECLCSKPPDAAPEVLFVRFALAIVAFIAAAVMIGFGIAQRTVLLEPDRVSMATEIEGKAAYTVIEPDALGRTPASRRSPSRAPTRCSSRTAAAPTSRHGSATRPTWPCTTTRRPSSSPTRSSCPSPSTTTAPRPTARPRPRPREPPRRRRPPTPRTRRPDPTCGSTSSAPRTPSPPPSTCPTTSRCSSPATAPPPPRPTSRSRGRSTTPRRGPGRSSSAAPWSSSAASPCSSRASCTTAARGAPDETSRRARAASCRAPRSRRRCDAARSPAAAAAPSAVRSASRSCRSS